jgi:tellurite resistance protein TerC
MTPLSHWLWFHAALIVLLALELVMRKRTPDPQRKAVYATVLWVLAALALAGFLFHAYGNQGSLQYLAGYAIEEALSIDNLFVFLLLFRTFRIPEERQGRVLFWGVAGAIVLRGAFIAGGLTLLEHFAWVDYVFGAILLFAAVRLLIPEKERPQEAGHCPAWLKWLTRWQPVSERQDKFFVRENGRGMITVLFLALAAIELTDVIFALDSIPAVLSITRVPFLAYTSNIMAVMGLRSLYLLLAAMLSKLKYLHFGLAAVLAFAAIKMLFAKRLDVGPVASLAVIAGLLGITMAASLATSRRTPQRS